MKIVVEDMHRRTGNKMADFLFFDEEKKIICIMATNARRCFHLSPSLSLSPFLFPSPPLSLSYFYLLLDSLYLFLFLFIILSYTNTYTLSPSHLHKHVHTHTHTNTYTYLRTHECMHKHTHTRTTHSLMIDILRQYYHLAGSIFIRLQRINLIREKPVFLLVFGIRLPLNANLFICCQYIWPPLNFVQIHKILRKP